MKVGIGDIVCTDDFGCGPIIAMTSQWCIYQQKNEEISVPWEEVYIRVERPDMDKSSIDSYEVSRRPR